MIKSFGLAALLVCIAAVANVNAQFTTDKDAFIGGLVGAHYEEGFGSLSPGQQVSWVAPGENGYGFTVDASDTNLYGYSGFLSVDLSSDDLVFTFTGAPVTAFGGNFWGTDFNGNLITGAGANITYTTNLGNTETLTGVNTIDHWLGFYSSAALTSVTISASGFAWVAADNVVLGSAVAIPEPGTAILGLLGLVGWVVKRRRSC